MTCYVWTVDEDDGWHDAETLRDAVTAALAEARCEYAGEIRVAAAERVDYGRAAWHATESVSRMLGEGIWSDWIHTLTADERVELQRAMRAAMDRVAPRWDPAGPVAVVSLRWVGRALVDAQVMTYAGITGDVLRLAREAIG